MARGGRGAEEGRGQRRGRGGTGLGRGGGGGRETEGKLGRGAHRASRRKTLVDASFGLSWTLTTNHVDFQKSLFAARRDFLSVFSCLLLCLSLGEP